MNKPIARVLVSILSISLLFSQSLVEISKKEQERREKLKGKNVKIVTNADLQSVGKKPAVVMGTAESAKEEAPGQAAPIPPAEPESAGYPEQRPLTGGEPVSYVFASSVLAETYLVENPEFALSSPDGRYAEISIMGSLDLEFSAKNGPGNDISIYAKRAGDSPGMPESGEEGIPIGTDWQWPDKMTYAVLASDGSGEWEAIGLGTGSSSPEKFDLGSLASIKVIRILFRYHANPGILVKPFRLAPAEFKMGIDAVEAIHR
jgi:hypothetical protein